MKREELSAGNRCFAKNMKKIAAAVLFLLVLGQSAAVKADWKSDANARIEANRKTSAEITVLGTGGNPVPDVTVDINQTKHSFAFGTCLNVSEISNDSIYRNFVLSHFEWAVCENDSKWIYNESTKGTVSYTNADNIYTWCNNNGIKMRGHCIFWEQQASLPSWLPNEGYAPWPQTSALYTDCQNRLNSVVPHFQGKFLHWDVDNEQLTDSFFDRLEVVSTDVNSRVWMYQRANQLDPNCILFVNEYSGNSFGGYDSGPYVTLIDNLCGKGAPIHAIGIQAHLAENTAFQPESYYNNVLQPLAVENLPVWATEFDAQHSTEATSADNIENFMRVCFSFSNMEGIIFWGFMQNQMWRSDAYLVTSSGTLTQRGTRYESLMNEWTTHDATITNTSGKAGFRGFQGTYRITLSKAGETTEVHIIQLDPNTTTAYISIDTNFISNPNDVTPPSPDPMTWASYPTATGPGSITMTATTATDESGVQYSFVCTAGGGHNSGWQLSATYTDTNLSPNTQYTYQVQARDRSSNHNTTAFSDSRSATTWPPDLTPPSPNPMTWAAAPSATGAYTITMTASTATDTVSPPVQYYFECITDGNKSSTWQSSPTYLASGLTPSTQYTFRVKARDNAPSLNETAWSTSLSATTPAAPINISLLGSWLTGTTHAKETGGSRALILIAHAEYSGSDLNLSSVTYGGQPMTKIIERNAGTGYRSYVVAYILDEAGVNAASTSTFTPTWNVTPESVSYASVFLENVNQATLIGATANNGTESSTPNPITTSALATNNGDMVIVGATCGNNGTYTLNNSFTQGTHQSVGTNGHTGVTGYKAATGAAETPSATHSSVNRQVIVGFVAQAGTPVDNAPAAPTGLIATAGNKSIILTWNSNGEPDMNGYNVYRSTTPGGGYAKLNGSLLTSPNYTDNGLTNGTPYYYVVTAVDLTGHESTNSGEATAIPNYQNCADALADGHRLPADLAGSGDCYVNFLDFAVLAGHWLDTTCVGPGNCDGADFEPNGVVDMFDLSDFANQWLTCNDPANPNCTQN
jgi:GH35 family endo-1,4-beta-xylanase